MYIFASAGFNLLEVNPGLVIWTLITFLIVVFVLKKFAWDLIINSLDQRSDKIQSDINSAEKLKKDSQALFDEYQNKIQSLQKQADNILSEARKNADDMRDNLLKQANQEVQLIKKNLSKEINLAKEKAVEDMKEKLIELSILVSQKVLEREIEKSQREFIESELNQFANIKFK